MGTLHPTTRRGEPTKGRLHRHEGPTYRRSKSKGRPDRAYVEFGRGHRVYLGEYGSDESYERAILEWRARALSQWLDTGC